MEKLTTLLIQLATLSKQRVNSFPSSSSKILINFNRILAELKKKPNFGVWIWTLSLSDCSRRRMILHGWHGFCGRCQLATAEDLRPLWVTKGTVLFFLGSLLGGGNSDAVYPRGSAKEVALSFKTEACDLWPRVRDIKVSSWEKPAGTLIGIVSSSPWRAPSPPMLRVS